ncbi:GAD-like domain-containing protein [Methylobacterium terrae]|nr:GAD-like domain-containing protein [Methylobacterium terrae]
MPEHDTFAQLIEEAGEPEQAIKVGYEDIERYGARLPNALLRFWQEHGRGSYNNGSYWICDPAPYQGIIEAIFKDDPDFEPTQMTVVGYDAFAQIWIWHRQRYGITVDLLLGTVYNPPDRSRISSETGKQFSADFSVGNFLSNFLYFDPTTDEDGEPLLPQARARLGPLGHNEVYGFFPALQLGGARRAENLRRVSAPEHMLFLASLEPLTVTRLTDPEPGYPFGRIVPVRRVGSP